jgi:hypothetical protein
MSLPITSAPLQEDAQTSVEDALEAPLLGSRSYKVEDDNGEFPEVLPGESWWSANEAEAWGCAWQQ